MKKLLSILFILILLCLSACATPVENQNENIQSKNSSSVNKTSSVNNDENSEDPTPEHFAISFNSLEAYNEKIDSCSVPKNFVAYSDISEFGQFSGFTLSKLNPSYRYTFQENEFKISLYVNHNTSPTLETVNVLPLNANADLQTCPGTSQGIEKFMHNGFLYDYRNGMLFSILWYIGDVRFYLTISKYDEKDNNYKPALHLYNGEQTAINALLNKDTAGSVKLAFDNMMAEKTAE